MQLSVTILSQTELKAPKLDLAVLSNMVATSMCPLNTCNLKNPDPDVL